MRLPITVPFHEGETPASAASRLARANGADKAWRFCLDIGFKFRDVVNGDAAALDHLAILGGFDREVPGTWALVRGRDAFYLRGQTLRSSGLLRTHMRACPRCLQDDMADTRVDPTARPYGRALWQIAGIRTCFEHGVALEEYRLADNRGGYHDVPTTLGPYLADIAEATTTDRSPSAFETYLRDRLVHGTGGAAWLDGLSFYAAMHLCEVMGAVARHGPDVRLSAMSDADRRQAGTDGYDVAVQGEAGIRRLLDHLQAPFYAGQERSGPKILFGRLYDWLSHDTDDPAYEPVRDVIRRHVIETMPVGPGDVVLGEEIRRRRNHSVQSASEADGLHPKRLRKVLYDAGYLDDAAMAVTNDRAIFDAATAEHFLTRLARSVSMKEVTTYLNAPRPIPQMLRDHGYIRPFVGSGAVSLGDYAFDPAELDAFLDSLTARAGTNIAGREPIAKAANRANCSQMEVVDLLVNDKLANVAVDPAG